MAQTPPPHNSDAPILQLFHSAGPHQRTNLAFDVAPALLRLLKAYKPSASQSVTVSAIGFPNVGNSSLISMLKRAKVRRRRAK